MKVNDIWGIINIEDKYLNVINSEEFKLIKDKLYEKLTLVTKRQIYNLNKYNGNYEFSFDETLSFIDDNKNSTDFMIECELISGSSCGLYYIDKLLEKFDFINSTTKSKKDIVLNKKQEKTLTQSK